ncbi:MAG: TonB-dependent receptor [Balneolaceae bacterium]|nr:TonB-dependent receptor [Balneolaceae bacterium]
MTKACTFAIVFLMVGFFHQPNLNAQNSDSDRYTFEFSGIELFDALKTIANSTEADIVFDPAILEDFYIYERIKNKTIEQILTTVLNGSGLDYLVLSSGTYVIIRTTKRMPEYGTFAGKIFDAQTGEVLPGATVMLADASGGTSSNHNGYFSLGKLKTGTYDIIFSYTGYRPVKKSVTISSDEDPPEQIALRSKRVDISPIVVSAHQPLMPINHSNELTSQMQTDWEAGSLSNDAIRALNLFSGVQYGLPMTDVHLQGGQNSDHRMFLDGVPVYNPYSFGQLYSAFSPYALGRISVEKTGFGASSGSHIAGKINLTHDLSNRREEQGTIQADPVNTNARFTIGSENSAFRLMGALRLSFWNQFQFPALSNTIQEWDSVDPLTYNILVNANEDTPLFQSAANQTDIRYHDLHLAGTYEIDDYRDFSFSVYQGRNFVETDLLASGMQNPEQHRMFATDTYDWNNLISQIQYNWIATPRLDIQAKLSYSSNRLHHQYSMFDRDQIVAITGNSVGSPDEELRLLSERIDEAGSQTDRNEIRHLTLKSDLSYSFSPNFSLTGGIKMDKVESFFDLEGLFYLPSVNQQNSYIYSSYVDAEWRPAQNFRLTGGSRFTMFGSGGEIYTEPRAAIQYDRSNTSIGYWSLRLSGGVYRQFINRFDITNVGPSSLVPSFSIWSHNNAIQQPLSYNANVDLLVEPTDRTSFRVEGYVKKQPSAYITSYNNLILNNESERTGFKSFAELTDMNIYGGGFRYHQALLNSDLQLLLGYDLSISRVNYKTQFGRVLPAPWNEPHRIQARVLGRLTPGLSVIAKWQSTFGRTWGFRQAYYDFLVLHNFNSAGSRDFLTPENDRLKPFHQLDLAFVYQVSAYGMNTEIRLDLINLLNRQNVIDQTLVPTRPELSTSQISEREFEVRERTMPGFTPSISVQIGF